MVTREGEGKSNNTHKNMEEGGLKNIPYREAIGSLLNLSNARRPDLRYAVNSLSKNQNNYTLEDWEKVKQVFCYLHGTTNYGLHYTGQR